LKCTANRTAIKPDFNKAFSVQLVVPFVAPESSELQEEKNNSCNYGFAYATNWEIIKNEIIKRYVGYHSGHTCRICLLGGCTWNFEG
jgi:hypothetical protein